MSSSLKRTQLVGSPPGSGKSEARKKLQLRLRELTGEPWIVLDNEDSFTPEMRVGASQLSGLALNSKEFVMGFNLPAQKAYQQLVRTLADQGFPVVAFGPFENVYGMVGDVSLYEKMRQDFAGYDFRLGYFLVSGEGAEAEVQRRLAARAQKSQWQSALDSDKLGVEGYYGKRAAMVRMSAQTFNLPLVEYPVGKSVDWLVNELAAMILS